MINTIIIQGRLCKDPVVSATNSGLQVARFRLANSTGGKGREQSLFIDVSCFGKTAEVIAKYTKKGSSVCITGRLTQRTYQNKSGVEVTTFGIAAAAVELLSPKDESVPAQPANAAVEVQKEPVAGNPQSIQVNDDDLPF